MNVMLLSKEFHAGNPALRLLRGDGLLKRGCYCDLGRELFVGGIEFFRLLSMAECLSSMRPYETAMIHLSLEPTDISLDRKSLPVVTLLQYDNFDLTTNNEWTTVVKWIILVVGTMKGECLVVVLLIEEH